MLCRHPNDPDSWDYRLDPPDDGAEQLEKAREAISDQLAETIEMVKEMISTWEDVAGEGTADELESALHKLEELK